MIGNRGEVRGRNGSYWNDNLVISIPSRVLADYNVTLATVFLRGVYAMARLSVYYVLLFIEHILRPTLQGSLQNGVSQ